MLLTEYDRTLVGVTLAHTSGKFSDKTLLNRLKGEKFSSLVAQRLTKFLKQIYV